MSGFESGTAEYVRLQFPLLDQLEFSDDNGGARFCPLPALVGVVAAATSDASPGDTCILLPSTEQIAAYVSVIVALTAAIKVVPDLLEKYVRSGFHKGELIRVLPNGEIYRFLGYFDEEQYGTKFFKLGILGEQGGSLTFPLGQGVRLKKTTRLRPQGQGNSNWGEIQPSGLDRLIGTLTAGNAAL